MALYAHLVVGEDALIGELLDFISEKVEFLDFINNKAFPALGGLEVVPVECLFATALDGGIERRTKLTGSHTSRSGDEFARRLQDG